MTLKEGDLAPAFTLNDSDRKKVSLKDFRGQKVVLYFYPKDMTPGCTQESCDFSENLNHFQTNQAVVIGISFDDEDSHQKFISKYNLKHILLSDTEKKVADEYGVYQEKNLYGKISKGIVRTTFIIDTDGVICKIFSKVKVEDHWSEVLEALKKL